MKTLILILLATVTSCGNADDNKVNTDSVSANKGSIKTEKDSASDNEVINDDSTIRVKFPRDSISTTVSGKMKGISHPVTVFIPIKQGRQLTASLKTDAVANIRINQIFMPDGKADGPFGRELKRTITQQGMYKLIIGENMMQGDEWKGRFYLTIKVE